MKIYVAGSMSDKTRVREIQARLEMVGHEITRDWTQPMGSKRTTAILDLRGVMDCDVFVLVAEKTTTGGGYMSELGAALALGKPVYTIGNCADSNVFMWHPHVRRGMSAFNRDLITEQL